MAQKRPAFRFRLPWLQFGSAPRPTPRPPSQPARTAANTPFLIAISESKPASQPSGTANLPAASGPSRGSSAPSRTQPSRVEPESSSRATELPVVTSQPTSPSRTTELPVVTSQPTSPSRATELQIASRPTSPTRAIEPHVPSQPASPSRAVETRVLYQPTLSPHATEAHISSQPTSPPHIIDARVSSQPASPPEPSVTSKPGSPPRTTKSLITSQPASPPHVSEPRVSSQPTSPRATEPHVTSQPASPPRAIEPHVTSQPASPPRATELHVTSQPASPPRAIKLRVASQPTSPPHAAEPHFMSQPASPPHTIEPQSQPPSPLRVSEPYITSQLRSSPHANQPHVTSQPASLYLSSKEAESLVSQPSSPSQLHSITQPTTQPQSPLSLKSLTTKQTSPSKIAEETLKPSPKPTETQSPVSDKENSATATIQPLLQPVELQSKPDTRADAIREAKVQQPEIKLQPSKESGLAAAEPSKKSKEVKQKTRDRDDYEAKQIDKEMLSTKGKSSTGFRSLKGQTDKTSQLRNKRVVSDSHFKPATSNEQHLPLQKEIKDSILKLVNKKTAVGCSKRHVEGRPVNVITLAGENTGASMQRGSDPSKKEGSLHIRRGYKTSAKETTDAAGESSVGRKSKDTKTEEDQSMKVYANSNVQCINNSVMSDSSTVERSPGVHLQLPRFPVEPVKSNDHAAPLEIQRAEFNTTLAEKPQAEQN